MKNHAFHVPTPRTRSVGVSGTRGAQGQASSGPGRPASRLPPPPPVSRPHHERFSPRDRSERLPGGGPPTATLSALPGLHLSVPHSCPAVYTRGLLESLVASFTGEFGPRPPPHLHLPVLCGVVQGGPAPGVSCDGGAHQQQPVQDGRVAAPGCEVQGRGPLVIPCGQADVGEGDLGEEGGAWVAEAGRG